MTDIGIYMNAVAEVAGIAGDIARGYYGGNPETRTKSDGSPVSVADVNAERAAREWIELRFPEDGIIGEELPSVRPSAARRWILDPIDGTYTFLQSVPLWGTLVAVAEGESVIAGAAYFPALDEIIVGARGEGCWWNGSRAAVSTVSELSEARLLTTDARFLRDEARRERWIRLQDSAAHRARRHEPQLGRLLRLSACRHRARRHHGGRCDLGLGRCGFHADHHRGWRGIYRLAGQGDRLWR